MTAADPTCTESGITEGSRCSDCGKIFSGCKAIPALGHNPGAALRENDESPSCTTAGSYDTVTYCTRCGAETSRKKMAVPSLGHDFAEEFTVDVEPTETTPGQKSRHCTRCSEVTDVTEIPPSKPEFDIGDANCDGSLNMKDVLFLRKIIAGTEGLTAEQMKYADLDGNGDINMKDVLKLRKIIAGAE